MRTRIKGGGHTTDGQPAYAEDDGTTLTFAIQLKAGGPGGSQYRVQAEKMRIPEATHWIDERMRHFEAHPGGRERIEDAVRRKVLAAHGQPFLTALMSHLSASMKMEAMMMFSSDSHDGIMALRNLPEQAPMLRVHRDGEIDGLDEPDIFQA